MTLLILSYLGGVLTILSPCILPVLPFVFARAQGSFLKNGLPLLLGMAITFAAFSGVAVLGGEWLARANEIGRTIALVLMTLFGLSMIFPHLAEAALAPLTRVGSKIGSGSQSEGTRGAILVGVSTGLLWAPCAGPILGLVLTGAASRGNVGSSVTLLLAYALGAITSLGAALVAGNRFLKSMKKFLGVDQVVKKVIGVAVLLGVVAIAFNLDRTVLTRFSKVSTDSLENRLLSLGGLQKTGEEDKSAIDELPELAKVEWLNSKPLTREDLKGKVVLIDFWTYSCINCLRTLPYLKAWQERYAKDGFVLIGVHTPEFAFEQNPENVKKAVSDLGITYPVALDSNHQIWDQFHNRYWPAHYFVDATGKIRKAHFGEGGYDESEKEIVALLNESGKNVSLKSEDLKMSGVALQSTLDPTQSPETYIGYTRAKNFVLQPERDIDEDVDYKAVGNLKKNEWSLAGVWNIGSASAKTVKPHAKITFRFRARDLHLVLGGKASPFVVRIDGHAPGDAHGVDITPTGHGDVKEQRLYQLLRLSGEDVQKEHTFEIEFDNAGVEAFAFTFG